MDRQQWLEERRTGIGGTDIGAILGLSPYMTAREVWDQKVGLTPVDDTMRPDAEIGLLLEPLLRKKYEERTGREVHHMPLQLIRHCEYPWMIATLDGTVIDGEHGVWEGKAPWSTTFWHMKRQGLPEHMIVQIQWYMLVTALSWSEWAIIDRNGGDLLVFRVNADTQLQARLFEEGKKFWECVKSEKWDYEEPMKPAIEMPELAGDDKVLRVDPGDAEWRSLIAMRQEAKAMADEAGYVEDEAKRKMQLLMGDHTIADVEGIARIYNRMLPPRGKPYEYFRVFTFEE